MPVLGHVLKHVPSHVLEHMHGYMLELMPKHVPVGSALQLGHRNSVRPPKACDHLVRSRLSTEGTESALVTRVF